MNDKIVVLTNENIARELIEHKGYTLIDFWAPWCGPCRMMLPIYEELANEVNNVKFCKVDVDKNQEIASDYRVSGIPFFVMFKDGKAIASKTGGTTKEDLKNWIVEKSKN